MDNTSVNPFNAFLIREVTRLYNARDFARLQERGISRKVAENIVNLPVKIAEKVSHFSADTGSVYFDEGHLMKVIQYVQVEDHRDTLIGHLIEMGASQAMLVELTGMDPESFRSRRRELGLPKAAAGRPSALNEDEAIRVLNAWQRHQTEQDILVRYYKVGMETRINLGRVWQHLQTVNVEA